MPGRSWCPLCFLCGPTMVFLRCVRGGKQGCTKTTAAWLDRRAWPLLAITNQRRETDDAAQSVPFRTPASLRIKIMERRERESTTHDADSADTWLLRTALMLGSLCSKKNSTASIALGQFLQVSRALSTTGPSPRGLPSQLG
ncbi:hypothetical protein GE09DRAFT_1165675 [Coniochaeta sp. 2T2.1]|nr:hypothetical protein GE09DRAFT_1165675 [Coniochaeta sp. 2T2.1]